MPLFCIKNTRGTNDSGNPDLIPIKKGAPELLHVPFRVRNIYNKGTINSATMFMILISGLIAGPAVSL